MELNEAYWTQRYLNQQTGWDVGQISTPLKTYIDQLSDTNIKILIPGCGNAHEAAYLLHKGFTNITLVDISGVLIQQLKQQFYPTYQGKLHLVHGDFFDLSGSYDLIIEQTFFCALDPKFRHNYARKMGSLLGKNGKLAGVLFNRQFGHEGPPYGGSQEEYVEYFQDEFELRYFEECYNSIPPRSGSEIFICLIKK
ncbi:methyltransferase domain-containing protein [bacterium]|nr:methyltransferase domain-containing protein [bacterium]